MSNNDKMGSYSGPALDGTEQYITEADVDTGEPTRIVAYGCPYCEFTASNESEVRSHITRDRDADHKGRQGFATASYVHGLNQNEVVIESVSREGGWSVETHESGCEEVSLVPEDASTLQQDIMAVCVTMRDASKKEMYSAVQDRGIECSYDYVVRTTREYLDVDPEERLTPRSERSWEELTETQRFVVELLSEYDAESDTTVTTYIEECVSEYDVCGTTMWDAWSDFQHLIAEYRCEGPLPISDEAVEKWLLRREGWVEAGEERVDEAKTDVVSLLRGVSAGDVDVEDAVDEAELCLDRVFE